MSNTPDFEFSVALPADASSLTVKVRPRGWLLMSPEGPDGPGGWEEEFHDLAMLACRLVHLKSNGPPAAGADGANDAPRPAQRKVLQEALHTFPQVNASDGRRPAQRPGKHCDFRVKAPGEDESRVWPQVPRVEAGQEWPLRPHRASWLAANLATGANLGAR